MSRTAIKICGVTRVEDVKAAVAAGANAIGLVFYPASKRYVSIEQAQQLLSVIPPFVATVGLFVDAEPEQVEDILRDLPLSLLQFHGEESAAYCEAFGRPYIKALRFKVGNDGAEHLKAASSNRQTLLAAMQEHSNARGFLLDAYDEAAAGGTGKQFDWEQVPGDLNRPIILAGGLNADNVATAIARVGPYAVDVSSGVETSPGIKAASLISAFVSSVESV